MEEKQNVDVVDVSVHQTQGLLTLMCASQNINCVLEIPGKQRLSHKH